MDVNTVVASLDELTEFKRGQVPLKPVVVSPTFVDVKELRDTLKMSQEAFAKAYKISADTIRGWEQGRRVPDGPARTLLALIQRHPEAIRKQIQSLESG